MISIAFRHERIFGLGLILLDDLHHPILVPKDLCVVSNSSRTKVLVKSKYELCDQSQRRFVSSDTLRIRLSLHLDQQVPYTLDGVNVIVQSVGNQRFMDRIQTLSCLYKEIRSGLPGKTLAGTSSRPSYFASTKR